MGMPRMHRVRNVTLAAAIMMQVHVMTAIVAALLLLAPALHPVAAQTSVVGTSGGSWSPAVSAGVTTGGDGVGDGDSDGAVNARPLRSVPRALPYIFYEDEAWGEGDCAGPDDPFAEVASALAVSGDTAVIGGRVFAAPLAPFGFFGAAGDGIGWKFAEALTPHPDTHATAAEGFGFAAALAQTGFVAFVSTVPGVRVAGSTPLLGAVDVFGARGSDSAGLGMADTWARITTLQPAAGNGDSYYPHFGASVAVSGGPDSNDALLAVGSPLRRNPEGAFSGATVPNCVFVYRATGAVDHGDSDAPGAEWGSSTQAGRVCHPDPDAAASDEIAFGWSLSFSGPLIAVGAPSGALDGSGEVYLIAASNPADPAGAGTTWTLAAGGAPLTPSGSTSRLFGLSVSLHASRAVLAAGDPKAPVEANEDGRVHFFAASDGAEPAGTGVTWIYHSAISRAGLEAESSVADGPAAMDISTSDHFGASVAFNAFFAGTSADAAAASLVVGAPRAPIAVQTNSEGSNDGCGGAYLVDASVDVDTIVDGGVDVNVTMHSRVGPMLPDFHNCNPAVRHDFSVSVETGFGQKVALAGPHVLALGAQAAKCWTDRKGSEFTNAVAAYATLPRPLPSEVPPPPATLLEPTSVGGSAADWPRFGAAVAIGDLNAAAAPADPTSDADSVAAIVAVASPRDSPNLGAVELFTVDTSGAGGAQWEAAGAVTNTGTHISFGASVAISDKMMMVGAPTAGDYWLGGVFFYTITSEEGDGAGDGGAPAVTITPHPVTPSIIPNSFYDLEFGANVAIRGDIAVAVDPGRAKVHLIRCSDASAPESSEWALVGRDGDSGDITVGGGEQSFGASVGVADSEVVVVGVPTATHGGQAKGAVLLYLYSRSATFFNFEVSDPIYVIRPPNSDLGAGDRFGQSLSIDASGTVLAVGAPGADSGAGKVHVFVRDRANNEDWNRVATIMPSDASDAAFGMAVHLTMSAAPGFVTVGGSSDAAAGLEPGERVPVVAAYSIDGAAVTASGRAPDSSAVTTALKQRVEVRAGLTSGASALEAAATCIAARSDGAGAIALPAEVARAAVMPSVVQADAGIQVDPTTSLAEYIDAGGATGGGSRLPVPTLADALAVAGCTDERLTSESITTPISLAGVASAWLAGGAPYSGTTLLQACSVDGGGADDGGPGGGALISLRSPLTVLRGTTTLSGVRLQAPPLLAWTPDVEASLGLLRVINDVDADTPAHAVVRSSTLGPAQSAEGGLVFLSGQHASIRFVDTTLEDGLSRSGGGGCVAAVSAARVELQTTTVRGCEAAALAVWEQLIEDTGEGGGIAAYSGASLTLTASTFEDNAGTAGGAVFVTDEGSTATVTGGAFTGNAASGPGSLYAIYGGAIAATRGATLTVSGDVTFSDNSAHSAGAVMVRGEASGVIADATFTGNEATVTDGGAVAYVEARTSSCVRCIFDGNTAANGGGALSVASPLNDASFTLTEAALTNNVATAGSGGGVVLYHATLDITGLTTSGNTALAGIGGAIAGLSPLTSLAMTRINVKGSNVVITGNAAVDGGGIAGAPAKIQYEAESGITVSNNAASRRGGGVFCEGGGFVKSEWSIDVTYNGNTAGRSGGAVYTDGCEYDTSTFGFEASHLMTGNAVVECTQDCDAGAPRGGGAIFARLAETSTVASGGNGNVASRAQFSSNSVTDGVGGDVYVIDDGTPNLASFSNAIFSTAAGSASGADGAGSRMYYVGTKPFGSPSVLATSPSLAACDAGTVDARPTQGSPARLAFLDGMGAQLDEAVAGQAWGTTIGLVASDNSVTAASRAVTVVLSVESIAPGPRGGSEAVLGGVSSAVTGAAQRCVDMPFVTLLATPGSTVRVTAAVASPVDLSTDVTPVSVDVAMLPCPAGTAAGASACTPCGLGEFGPDGVECLPCQAGSFADRVGSESCALCPVGSYSEDMGATASAQCVECESSMTTLAAGSTSRRACQPNPGFFVGDDGEAVECGAGMDCSAGVASLAELPVLPGYWRATTATDVVHRCPGGISQCPGGAFNVTSAMVAGGGSSISGMIAGRDAMCGPGATGPLCGVCADDYFADGNGRCKPCSSTTVSINATGMMFLGITLAVGIVLLYVKSKRKAYRRKLRALKSQRSALRRNTMKGLSREQVLALTGSVNVANVDGDAAGGESQSNGGKDATEEAAGSSDAVTPFDGITKDGIDDGGPPSSRVAVEADPDSGDEELVVWSDSDSEDDNEGNGDDDDGDATGGATTTTFAVWRYVGARRRLRRIDKVQRALEFAQFDEEGAPLLAAMQATHEYLEQTEADIAAAIKATPAGNLGEGGEAKTGDDTGAIADHSDGDGRKGGSDQGVGVGAAVRDRGGRGDKEGDGGGDRRVPRFSLTAAAAEASLQAAFAAQYRLAKHTLAHISWHVQLKILVGLAQVLAVASEAFNIQFPDTMAKLMSSLRVFNLDLFSVVSVGCVFEVNAHTRLVTSTVLPLSAVALAIFVGIAVSYCAGPRVPAGPQQPSGGAANSSQRRPDREGGDVNAGVAAQWGRVLRHRQLTRVSTLAAIVLITFLAFPGTSLRVLSIFKCTTFEDGAHVLATDVSIDCDSEEHASAVAYAWIMVLVFPVGIPLAYLAGLCANRRKLYPVNRHVGPAITIHAAPAPAYPLLDSDAAVAIGKLAPGSGSDDEDNSAPRREKGVEGVDVGAGGDDRNAAWVALATVSLRGGVDDSDAKSLERRIQAALSVRTFGKAAAPASRLQHVLDEAGMPNVAVGASSPPAPWVTVLVDRDEAVLPGVTGGAATPVSSAAKASSGRHLAAASATSIMPSISSMAEDGTGDVPGQWSRGAVALADALSHVTTTWRPGPGKYSVFADVEARSGDTSIQYLSPLFVSYAPPFWSFEIFAQIIKLLLTSVVGLLVAGQNSATMVGILVALVALCTQLSLRPFLSDADNKLAAAAHIAVVVVLLTGLMLQSRILEQDGVDTQTVDTIGTAALITVVVLSIVAILYEHVYIRWIEVYAMHQDSGATRQVGCCSWVMFQRAMGVPARIPPSRKR